MPLPQVASGDLSWRVSQRCDGGACVMVGHQGEFILVGDSALAGGNYISYTPATWNRFLLNTRQGKFDRQA